ncbi:MAG: hypothetical protein JNN28_20620 [Saprospiraceae bacterium]|nr:hypothetical protein [Saprospiraceae bacterium]
MKYALFFPFVALILFCCLHSTSCQTGRNKTCVATQQPLEINFDGFTLQGIQFSPFEEGKIWVRAIHRDFLVWEIDVASGQKVLLDQNMAQYFFTDNNNGTIQYRYQDPFSPIIWVGAPNKNVVWYDQKNKTLNELPIRHARWILPTENEVFMADASGLLSWNRNTHYIQKIAFTSSQKPQEYTFNKDSSISLNAQFTYHFTTKTLTSNVVIGQNGITLNQLDFNATTENFLVTLSTGILYAIEGISDQIPAQDQPLYNAKISNNKIWYSDNQFYYAFDPKTKLTNKYAYKIPPVNNYAGSFEADDEYLWLLRPGQTMLVRLSDNQQFDFAIQAEEMHLRTILDDCNVYSLYKDKVYIASKAEFIKQGKLFDVNQYNNDLARFNDVVDSLGLMADSLPGPIMSKLHFLHSQYAGIDHVEIKQKLHSLKTTAFNNVNHSFPAGYIACYQDTSLPTEYRISCISYLVNQYGSASNFQKVLHFDQEYKKYFGIPSFNDQNHFGSAVDSVKRYLFVTDSLDNTNLTEDSIYYFKALALNTICLTKWHCSEGCAGCDFSLVTNKLKSFMAKFPNSKLVDNAALLVIEANFRFDYTEDEALAAQIRAYERFLKKYPDSDVKPGALYSIFMSWSSMYNSNTQMIKASGKRFIEAFPKDKRVQEVQQQLKYIH